MKQTEPFKCNIVHRGLDEEVAVLEPKHAVVEYGRTYRPDIKYVEGGAENIPLPDDHFDKVVTSALFHHLPKQDRSLEEMKRVLKPNGKMIIIEIDPNTARGKRRFAKVYCIQEPNFMNQSN